MPEELGGVAGLPKLVDALPFDDATVAKITHENWLRVLRAKWK